MKLESSRGEVRTQHLFRIGVLALFTAAFTISLRGAVSADLKSQFLDPLDLANSGALIGAVLGASFTGFALTLFLTSAFLDYIGMGRMAVCSAVCAIVGTLALIFTGPIAAALGGGKAAYWVMFIAVLVTGIGWGCVESFTNPMTAALYPEERTHRLNVLHAWWPAGLVAGGLVGVLVGKLHLNWQVVLALTPIPALVYGYLALGEKFPATEARTLQVPFKDMVLEVFRRPSFFIWFGAMFLTSASELAPGQWVQISLTHVVGMQGILLLVYISAIMFVARHFAGSFEARLTATGLLWVSSLLAAIGLYLLGNADSPVSALVAATFWGVGVCFMWPTMLAQASKRYPRGGAWSIGLVGAAGALSIQFVLPAIGGIYDQAKLQAAGGEAAFAALAPDGGGMARVLAFAAQQSFRTLALFPVVLLVVFGGLWLADRSSRAGKPA
jgi:MFS family permease